MDEHLAAFKKLSSALQAKIQSRPTETLLTDSTVKTRASYAEISKLWNLEDPNPAARSPTSFDGRVTWKGLLGDVEDLPLLEEDHLLPPEEDKLLLLPQRGYMRNRVIPGGPSATLCHPNHIG